MDARRVIETVLTEVAPYARVSAVEEAGDGWRVTLVGTSTVSARCEVPRRVADAAGDSSVERQRLGSTLKACADRVVALVPDARA